MQFIIVGPYLPVALKGHCMVSLGLGQALIGGQDSNDNFQSKIYHLTCHLQICIFFTMNQELSVARAYFLAIPIPDSVSSCILKDGES